MSDPSTPTQDTTPVSSADHSQTSSPAPSATQPASTSLYVGELDPSVTEAMLFEMFNMVGPVASIRVCRDAVTRRSLGYAYVNYHNAADGERALETLNYTLIKGKPCRIMWSQRDPSLRRTGAGNIFIKNLDTAIDNKALHDTFSAFGPILSCKVATDHEGNSKGYGFVHYETSEAAEQAIANVNGMLLNDKKVYVGHHVPRKERQSRSEELKQQFTNVYIKNLDTEVTDNELEELCKKFGNITSAVVQKDDEGKSKGFGFVNFETHEAAAKAVEELNESDYKGQNLFVSRAQKKSEREEELRKQYEAQKMERLGKYQGVNLYVKNLDEDVDDDKLRQEFAVYGNITSAKVMRDDKDVSKGFGFVCFASPDEATKAVTEMNGRMIGSKPVYVALAQRKEARKSQLEAQMLRNQQRMPPMGMPMGGPGGFVGAPMYYPPAGFMGPGQRPMYAPQPGMHMMPRPRWGQPGQGMGMPPGAYPQPPQPYMQMPNRPQRPQANNLRGNYKYNPQRPAQQSAPSSVDNASNGDDLASTLASAPEEQRKQILGEKLYPLIAEKHTDMAGKITGMLLEMDNTELLHLVEDSDALDAKINEAIDVLNRHNAAVEETTA
ncbi:hypothetical protein BZG36_03098 [Bifiguratus adelaidae]|uniref:Polyadenylate-binding protein n=1 Tax=Bifiguratus adelaidae TaxID=1938954 RepID=A0A261XZ09_9FUNG|nr:hypothetical protein BZG36_03098 [Bifiguratus adelaidae]